MRILTAPETERFGIAGKTGSVYGETTPTVSGVEVIGTLARDFALNVYLEDIERSFWLAENLVELVDHSGDTAITIEGCAKVWVRAADGEWLENDIH